MPALFLNYLEESSPSYILGRLRLRPSALASRTSSVAASWLYTACQVHEGLTHRVYRVPGFLSSRPNWAPQPLPARECWVQRGRHTRLQGLRCGDSNSDEGTDTVVLYVHYCVTDKQSKWSYGYDLWMVASESVIEDDQYHLNLL
jgi:hypothetical protein